MANNPVVLCNVVWCKYSDGDGGCRRDTILIHDYRTKGATSAHCESLHIEEKEATP